MLESNKKFQQQMAVDLISLYPWELSLLDVDSLRRFSLEQLKAFLSAHEWSDHGGQNVLAKRAERLIKSLPPSEGIIASYSINIPATDAVSRAVSRYYHCRLIADFVEISRSEWLVATYQELLQLSWKRSFLPPSKFRWVSGPDLDLPYELSSSPGKCVPKPIPSRLSYPIKGARSDQGRVARQLR